METIRIYEKGDIIRNQIIVGSHFAKIKTHLISPISRHTVRNITFFFLSSHSITRIANLFSVSCTLVTNDVEMWQGGGGGGGVKIYGRFTNKF